MSAVRPVPAFGLVFPDSDGQPMAENTRQYEAIVTLKGNIEAFAPADAFVAGDHLIYVDARDPTARHAPDVYVAFGRPRGHRGSYKGWEEGDVFPQVIFEVLGPGNTAAEMRAKRRFYFHHGAEEYYVLDPEYAYLSAPLMAFRLENDKLSPVRISDNGIFSPRLGLEIVWTEDSFRLYNPNTNEFLRDLEESETEIERLKAELERLKAQN